MQRQRIRRSLAQIAVLAIATSWGPSAWAEQGAPAPQVELRDLLRVPDEVKGESRQVRRGGFTAAEWRARFAAAEADREDAEASLAAARKKLEGIALETGQWQISAPGGIGATDAAVASGDVPLNYRLHEDIRRYREDVARSERRIRDLEIQANLAAVPEDWRRPAGETEDGPSASHD